VTPADRPPDKPKSGTSEDRFFYGLAFAYVAFFLLVYAAAVMRDLHWI
jgi:hypothetical protein